MKWVRGVTVVSALVAGAVAAAGVNSATPDHAAQAWNVLPPGQAGGVAFSKSSTDQIALYDGLTPLRDKITDTQIQRHFKRATLGLGNERAVSTERPRPGLVIRRDRWQVPHITGKRDIDVAYGAGWVTAQDRQLLIELMRGPGRIAALDVPGLDAFAAALSGKLFVPSAATEARLTAQFKLLAASGPDGQRAVRIIDAYVAGINAYYKKAGFPLAPWTRADVVGIAGLIGGVFGAGGGDEWRRANFLALLQKQLGDEGGRQVWEDLRQRDDPEARVAVEGTFPYLGRPRSELGNVVIDAGSFTSAGPTSGSARTSRMQMSNALLLTSGRSVTKHPLVVAGPQVGHYYPGILMELDLQGGGFASRGAAFPGISFAVLLGRGLDYVWSATSASGDLVDQYAETLCDGSDTKYLHKGQCREMTVFDAGTLRGAPGTAEQRLVYRETVHGPVLGYATVGGVKVAISQRRSTRGRELLATPFFIDLSTNRIRSAQEFVKAATAFELTFNWLYADDRDIAQATAGRFPVRPSTVDSGLPVKGTGEYEWTGFMPAKAHPQVINPKSGAILNWNNKPARGFGAADAEWTWGSVQRVDLLWEQVQKRKVHTLASLVGAMNLAATQDLRAVRAWPVIRQVLDQGLASPAATGRARAAAALVDAWVAADSTRLDVELDGKIDDPGAAVLDASWTGILDAAFEPVLGPLTGELAKLVGRNQPLNPGGSAFYDGWWSWLDKDLRSLLGRPVKGAFTTRFCGKGNVGDCSAALWRAIDTAAASLEQAQGTTPGAWRADATAERIRFSPGILPRTMRGTNRPTFQQVFWFRSHRPR